MAARARVAGVVWAALVSRREEILTAIADVLADAEAERRLDRLLRGGRPWTGPERAAAAELLFGVSVWRRRLSARVDAPAPGAAELAVAYLCELGGCTPSDAAAGIGLAASPPWRPLAPETGAGVRYSFPDWLVDHFAREVEPDGLEPLLDALNLPAPMTLRVNPLRVPGGREALASQLAAEEGARVTPSTWSGWGLRVEGRLNVLGARAHRDGAFEVQDEGSQLIGLALGAAPGERVLDLCAGAGGKALLLAGAVGPTGQVVACDVDGAKLERLRVRAVRAGADAIVQIRHGGADGVGEVDRVLVDAPCSELGTLRRGPDRRFRLDPGVLARWPETQRALLAEGARHVRPGGVLVYATCTLNRAENEAVIERFLAEPEGRGLRLEPVPHGPIDGPFLRTLPHRHEMDGFFAARFRRT